MKKNAVAFFIAALMLGMFPACREAVPPGSVPLQAEPAGLADAPDSPAGTGTSGQDAMMAGETRKITFPAYQYGKEDFKGSQNFIEAVYGTPPFDVAITLPGSWVLEYPQEGEETQAREFFTIINICHKGQKIGYIGFNQFTPYEGEISPEDYYKTVYSGLRLSRTCIWDPYTPVKATETGETGIAEIQYIDPAELDQHPGTMPEAAVIETSGILSYDKALKVFIGIEFAPGMVTEAQMQAIAQSIVLTAR